MTAAVPCRRAVPAPGSAPALVLALLVALAAVSVLLLPEPARAATADDEIQVLDAVDGPGDRLTLEVAVPPALGELAPVDENFGVTQNGDIAEATVAPVDTAVDVVVVLDTSGSMSGSALVRARDAAASFIGQLPPTARVGVISFGDVAVVEAAPATDRTAALAALDELRATGETALWDALALAADTVQDLGADRPYVVVLSDGDDTVSTAGRDAAVERLREARAGLYAIAIDSADADHGALDGIVDAVGGQFVSTDDVDELTLLYGEVAGRLTNRYRLTFPTDPAVDRSIVVSVAAGGVVATTGTTVEASTSTDVDSGTAPPVDGDDAAALGTVTTTPGALGGPVVRIVGIAALAAALLVVSLMLALPAVDVRLDSARRADRVAGLNDRLTSATDRLVARRDAGGELDKALDAAGLRVRPGEFVLLSLVGVVATSMVVAAVAGGLAGGVTALVASIGTSVFVTIRIARRRQQFAEQLTDGLGIMVGSLRAGRGLPQAVEMVAQEAPSPIAEEFQRIVFETRIGQDMTASMSATAERMKSRDLEWVTRAVDINRELGGDLTEVLTNVADTIRDRRRISRQVRALSAEGRASGWVLLALPVLMFLFLVWRTPEHAAQLVDTSLGRLMLSAAVAGMVAGYVWIRKLVAIEY